MDFPAVAGRGRGEEAVRFVVGFEEVSTSFGQSWLWVESGVRGRYGGPLCFFDQ